MTTNKEIRYVSIEELINQAFQDSIVFGTANPIVIHEDGIHEYEAVYFPIIYKFEPTKPRTFGKLAVIKGIDE